jgi:hypothetical protein
MNQEECRPMTAGSGMAEIEEREQKISAFIFIFKGL